MVRVAMWSGPRNISTALMRSFAARPDTVAVDEPFYAAYLARTGLNHPMREEIIAADDTDAQAVAASLLAPLPPGRTVHYQKHMTQHMIAGMPRGWIDRVTSAFLIREPARVLASYAARREEVALADIGFVEQAEIFDQVAGRLGAAPPVIAAPDLLADPPGMLAAFCARLGIAYTDAMLSWKPGLHAYDGVWARHWYQAVAATTGFAAPQARTSAPALPAHLQAIAEQAQPYYARLAAYRLVV